MPEENVVLPEGANIINVPVVANMVVKKTDKEVSVIVEEKTIKTALEIPTEVPGIPDHQDELERIALLVQIIPDPGPKDQTTNDVLRVEEVSVV